ncbi:MAG: hypothetical protein M1820_000588 [Bogoriella megaspora]|nr:MAG: hypothetical protein M1820_000588 [Bogoriella megaspora]
MSTPEPVEQPPIEENLPQYYHNLGCPDLLPKLKNLDDFINVRHLENAVTNPYSRNFMVDFGDDDAFTAFDLSTDLYSHLFRTPRPSSLYTRWINIWYPYDHQSTLELIAERYDLSPRLLGLMCSSPHRAGGHGTANDSRGSSSFFAAHRPMRYLKHLQERAIELEEGWKGWKDIPIADEPLPDLNHYLIADEVWHYNSVDWGRKYVCIGYNSVHNIRASQAEGAEEAFRQDEDLPQGKRIWNWLLLCDDKTVISISEDPFPHSGGHFSAEERKLILFLRRNLLNCFVQLSHAADGTEKKSPLTTLPIRKSLGNSPEEKSHRPSDSPGLLFYFLFDDWYSHYSLVIRREHRYQAELNRMRQDMLRKAELKHIDRLHHIGRQLAVLKRLYQSYESIIGHVLEKQTATPASLANSNIITSESQEPLASSQQVVESESMLGVSLSSAARVRFLRLKDRIRLFALSEIQDCMDQKESLVFMNFNLIAIKESYAVERLTRITLLLGKVTILFMPVSLMTGYFGAELTDATFDVKKYWISFTVILTMSAILLLGFGAVSGTMEGRMITRSASRTLFDMWRGARRKQVQ